MTTLKKHVKDGIMLIIECNGSPMTIAIKLSKKQIVKVLDVILPDDKDILISNNP